MILMILFEFIFFSSLLHMAKAFFPTWKKKKKKKVQLFLSVWLKKRKLSSLTEHLRIFHWWILVPPNFRAQA